jgi:hypothetical protein
MMMIGNPYNLTRNFPHWQLQSTRRLIQSLGLSLSLPPLSQRAPLRVFKIQPGSKGSITMKHTLE